MSKLWKIVVVVALGYCHALELREVTHSFVPFWEYPVILYLGNFVLFAIASSLEVVFPTPEALRFLSRGFFVAGLGLWGGVCLSALLAPSCCPKDLYTVLLMTIYFAWPLPLIRWVTGRHGPAAVGGAGCGCGAMSG